MDFDFPQSHPLDIVDLEAGKTRRLAVGDLVKVPACQLGEMPPVKEHAAVVIGIYGHKTELLGGPNGTEVWDISDLIWLKGTK